MMSFNDFVPKHNLKNKATSNTKNSTSPMFYWLEQCWYISTR